MARGLFLAVGLLALSAPAGASAQSMNVRQIVDDVVGQVCAPLAQGGDLRSAARAAERLGYSLVAVEPDHRMGAADLQPEPRALIFTRRHHGTVRISRDYDHVLCSLGVEEGGVGRSAEAAEPHLRALGLTPVIDERDGDLPLSVWRGERTQAVIARSPHHRPGVEVILTVHAPRGR